MTVEEPDSLRVLIQSLIDIDFLKPEAMEYYFPVDEVKSACSGLPQQPLNEK